MRNSILRFKEILLEGIQLDEETIQDLIQDLKDELDLNFEVTEGYLSESSLKKGIWGDSKTLFKKPTSSSDKKCYKLIINLAENKTKSITEDRTDYPIFHTEKIFEIFTALNNISKRTESYIQLSGKSINFFMIVDEDVKEDETGLYQLYTQIRDRFDKLKSDFGYSTIVKIEDDKIIIKTDASEYTDRKLNLALRGLSILYDFKMTKRTEGEGFRGEVFNIIEKK
jgi:hypothetical protein